MVVAAGAPGVELLPEDVRRQAKSLKLAIDLNAVPPAGIGGIQPQDKAVERDGQICYGAIGVGGTKMKLHKAAIRRLFESNDAGARCRGDLRAGREDLTTKARRHEGSDRMTGSDDLIDYPVSCPLCPSWFFF